MPVQKKDVNLLKEPRIKLCKVINVKAILLEETVVVLFNP